MQSSSFCCLNFHIYEFSHLMCSFFFSPLQINPQALLPGAAPPTKAPQETAVSFDQPVQTKTLASMTKVRERGRKEEIKKRGKERRREGATE